MSVVGSNSPSHVCKAAKTHCLGQQGVLSVCRLTCSLPSSGRHKPGLHLLSPAQALQCTYHVRVPIPPFYTLFFFYQYYQKVETLNGCCHLALEDAVCSFLCRSLHLNCHIQLL